MRILLILGYLSILINAFVPPISSGSYLKKHPSFSLISMKMSYLDHIDAMRNATRPRQKPVPVLSFDEFFLNINGIKKIYLSVNRDRFVMEYKNTRGIYYIKKYETDKMKYLLSVINTEIQVVINIASILDDLSGPLYFSETDRINKTMDDYIYRHYNASYGEMIENLEDSAQ